MRIIFDLNGTVIGSVDYSLRPGIKETIKKLREAGVQVDFWTGGPVDQYADLLRSLGIEGDIYSKKQESAVRPDVCVDDEPQDWMPGRIVKVDAHVSDSMPGREIDLYFLNRCEDSNYFFWD